MSFLIYKSREISKLRLCIVALLLTSDSEKNLENLPMLINVNLRPDLYAHITCRKFASERHSGSL